MEKETKKKNTTKSSSTKNSTTKKSTKKDVKTTKKVETVKEVKEEKVVEPNPIKNTMSDRTRYIIVGIICIIFLGLIIFLAATGSKEKTSSNSTGNESGIPKQGADRNTSTAFLAQLYDVIDSKDKEIIFFASDTCGYCQLQKPILENIVSDYNLDYFDVNVSEHSEAEINEVVQTLGLEGSTPTTIVVQDGKIINTLGGYADGKEFVNFLVQSGVLKQGSVYKREDKLKDINYSDLKKIKEKKGTSAVLVDVTACNDCITVRSKVNEIAKSKDIVINYLSSSYLTQAEVTDFQDKLLSDMGYSEAAYKKDKTIEVPLFLIIKDGKIKKHILGNKDKKEYEKVLKEYKLIK